MDLPEHIDLVVEQAKPKDIGVKQKQEDTFSCRILIVDDNKNNRDVIALLLAPLGFEILEASNGKEAVRVWNDCCSINHPPDSIWMDVRMPIINGFEAAKEIRKLSENGGYYTKIIAISATVFEQDSTFLSANVCDDFLMKPFKAINMLDRMKHHLDLEYIIVHTSPTGDSPVHRINDDIIGLVSALPEEWKKGSDQGS